MLAPLPVKYPEKYDVTKHDGKVYSLYPKNTCAAKCMLCMFSGGSGKMQYTMKVRGGGDFIDATNFKACGCLPLSPIPCCMYCGVGPCAFYGAHERSKDPATPNLYVGKGRVCAASCCDMCICCFHHDHDWFVLDDEHDGSSPEKAGYYTPGGKKGNPMTPPCIAGPCSCCDNTGLMINIEKGAGKPIKSKLVVPAKMER
jgi:hypothetical protein